MASACAQGRPIERRVKALRVLLLLLATSHALLATLHAQPGGYSTTDKGAIKRYESGSECMRMQKWECAESEFTKAAAADERFLEPRIMLADIAERKNDDAEAMKRYNEVIAINPRFFPIQERPVCPSGKALQRLFGTRGGASA
jgi:Tfp pilus assembly protein PilF